MKSGQLNLLFVFSDQHRKCSLGCYGDPQVETPNLDRFAREGVRFDHCIANSPVCVPMRGSLLTGRYAWNHRAITNDLPVDPATPSLADALEQAGYHTGYIGKWHLGGIPRDKAIPAGERLGFTGWKAANCNHSYDRGYYFDESCRRHELPGFQSVGETDLALDFIRRNSTGEQPWALFLSWSPPHEPFDAIPGEFLDRYDPEKLTLRGNVPAGYPDAAKLLQGYYALTSLLDREFGRLLALVDELGLVEETLIVYTSDHGDLLGSHNLRNKQLPHEESIAVPLLMAWKGHCSPQVRQDLIGLVDLPATVAGILGIGLPGADGRDINRDRREAVLIYDLVPCHQAADRNGHEWMGVRTERWTYARRPDKTCDVLFDNDADPLQLNNLADEPSAQETVVCLGGMLDRELAACRCRFRPWREMIVEDGYFELWSRSQEYFGRKLWE